MQLIHPLERTTDSHAQLSMAVSPYLGTHQCNVLSTQGLLNHNIYIMHTVCLKVICGDSLIGTRPMHLVYLGAHTEEPWR